MIKLLYCSGYILMSCSGYLQMSGFDRWQAGDCSSAGALHVTEPTCELDHARMGQSTSNQVTLDNWFSNTGSQTSEITADGLKLDSQVANIVTAMATYASNNPSFNATTATSMPTNTTLQNAIAASWHS
jgi:hypothetical protein